MGALEELAAQLLGAQTQHQIAAENPYYRFASVPSDVGSIATKMVAGDPKRYKLKDGLAWGLGSGLLSGILQGAGDQYQNTLTDRFQKVAGQAMLGQTPSDEGLSPSLFRSATDSGKLFRMQQGIQAAQREQDFLQDRTAKIHDKLLDNGQVILPDGSMGEIRELNPAVLAEDKAAAEARGKLRGESDALGYNPKGEEEIDKLRKEFSALPEVKNFVQVEKAAGIVGKALEDDSAVTDLELTRYAILLIEPGMAVREGEQAAVANSQSIPEAWKGEIDKALTSGTALRQDVREGLKRLAARAYEGHKTQYDRTLSYYQNEARTKKLDPNRISYIGPSSETEQILGPVPPPKTDMRARALAELKRRGVVK